VSVSKNARSQAAFAPGRTVAAFAGGSVGFHANSEELFREGSLGADNSMEPRRFSFSDVQRDGRTGFWETLRVTRGLRVPKGLRVALALSLTNVTCVERENTCFKHAMKSARGEDILMWLRCEI
jgi:hypothetical protein